MSSVLRILFNSIGAGLPFTSSAVVDVKQVEGGLSAELALHAGAQELKLTLQRRLHNSTDIAGRLLVSTPFSISPQFSHDGVHFSIGLVGSRSY